MGISDLMNEIKEGDSPKEKMKKFILSLSNELHLEKGHTIPMSILLQKAMVIDSEEEREAVIPALESLVEDGYFECRDDSYFLTQKGKDQLF